MVMEVIDATEVIGVMDVIGSDADTVEDLARDSD